MLVAGLHVDQVVSLKRAQKRRDHVAHDDLILIRADNGERSAAAAADNADPNAKPLNRVHR
jgi:hypothetical protein